MLIENISHACIKYHFKNFSILTDPWIVDLPIKSYMVYKFPEQKEKNIKKIISNVKYCYISHTHEDHFHIPSLKKLNKDITMIIPNFSKYNNLRRNDVLYETLKKLGFKKIVKMSPWEKLKISDEVSLTLIPSAKTRYFDWENSGLAISFKKQVVLNMNDNVADKELLKKIRAKIGKIFIYFVQTAGISIHPACFSYSKTKKKELIKKKVLDFDLQDNIIQHLKPEYLIPYAGDFGWFGTHEDYNYWSRLTPLPLLDYLKKRKIKTLEFNPSDKINLKNQKLTFEKNNIINWHDYKKLIKEHSLIYKNQINKKIELIKKNKISKNLISHAQKYIDSLNRVNSQSNSITNFNSKICYCIRNKTNNKVFFYILVNALRGKVLNLSLSKTKPKEVYQIHYIENDIFNLILKGKIMLNECQWSTEVKQIKPFNKSNRDLLFHIGYHIDGDNRSPELKIRKIYSA